MDDSIIEITGRVTNVSKSFTKEKTFSVMEQDGTRRSCITTFFCPLQNDDVIYASCKPLNDGRLYVVRPPFVQPSASKESVVKCLVTMAKMGYRQANQFYDKLERDYGDVIMHISKTADKWVKSKNPKILIDMGLDEEKGGHFLAKWNKQRNYRRLYLLGLTKTEISACELDTEEIYRRCLDNPFTLYGITIEKAVEIVMRRNGEFTNEDIKRGQILRYIHKNSKERGWSGTPTNTTLRVYPDYTQHMEVLHSEYQLTAEHFTIFLKKYARVEQEVAEAISELLDDDVPIVDNPYLPDDRDIILNVEQREAVEMALTYGISIITGGPGTGKSTLVSVICENLEMLDKRYILCSFTGAAVSRLKEITGREAFTIHQLVNRIKKYKDYVSYHMIIIDEYSMVTTGLFCELLGVLKSYEFPWPKFLFVGDVDQLPPIEWGDLALQLTSIPQIPKTILKTNMRVYQTLEGEKDGILAALETISTRSREEREGTYKAPTATYNEDPGYEPDDYYDPDDMEPVTKLSGPFEETDNFFIYPGTIDDVYDIIIDVYKRNLHQDDITIISPYNACLADLNSKFEQIFHEEDRFTIDHWNNKWHIGSRIMCLENNYDLPIYNGTEAIVEDFNEEVLMIKVTETKIVNGKAIKMSKIYDIPLKPRIKKPQVDPETGDPIEVEEFNTNKFMLSYAITTHKAQGNQWPYVVYYIPYGKGSSNFINRNQVYTAISRARRAVWIIGDIDAFYDSLGKGIPYRHNTLAMRAKELIMKK